MAVPEVETGSRRKKRNDPRRTSSFLILGRSNSLSSTRSPSLECHRPDRARPWSACSRCSRYSGSYSHPLARGGLSERSTRRNSASFLISSVIASMGSPTSAGTVIRSPGASWCTKVYSTLLTGNSVSRLVLTLILCPCTYSRIVFPSVVLLLAVLAPTNSNRLALSPVGMARKRKAVGLFVGGLRLRILLGHPSYPAATRQARRSSRSGA